MNPMGLMGVPMGSYLDNHDQPIGPYVRPSADGHSILTIMARFQDALRFQCIEDTAGRREQEFVELFLAHTIGCSCQRTDAVKIELWSRLD